ncbi:hypothetical protein RR48_06273 [Papilio machaon]|uniref:Uncharacterized protein n=1 Tax=Papilio machaon TaxID=76193 RepID=A0A194R687_PAPMA|nr:hypothetical protein RR48_06273 [Papilio machaon]
MAALCVPHIPTPAPAPTPTPTPAPTAVATPTATPTATPPAGKHKCPRKQRVAPPHSDHHLPPPPDILEEQRTEVLTGQPRNTSLPDSERNMLEVADPSGPPTLATSALHALDIQFCAQGKSHCNL